MLPHQALNEHIGWHPDRCQSRTGHQGDQDAQRNRFWCSQACLVQMLICRAELMFVQFAGHAGRGPASCQYGIKQARKHHTMAYTFGMEFKTFCSMHAEFVVVYSMIMCLW